MNYTTEGKIVSISEVTSLESGAKKLTYRIDTGEQYNNIWEFELYKGADYAEHADNFVKFNSVGDLVSVEFNVRPRVWEEKDRVFTTLSHWKCTTLEKSENAQAVAGGKDDLPF